MSLMERLSGAVGADIHLDLAIAKAVGKAPADADEAEPERG